MKLTNALKKNSAALQDAQANYQQCVFDISNMMTSIFAATLPNVNNVPTNWAEVKTAYINAKADALKWTNQVYATLQETPDDVRNYNTVITDCLNDAIIQAQGLSTGDPEASQAALNADLKTISSKLNLVNTFVSGCLDTFDQFGYQTLPEAAADLTEVSNDAYIDYQIDQQKINELKKEIKETEEEIAKLAAEIGINAAAIAGEVAIGACFLALGPAEWAVVGIGIAVSSTTIVLDSIKLVEDQNKLKQLNSQLDSYSQDASALQITSDQYSEMATQTVALNGSVNQISSSWQTLEDDVNEAIGDISDAKADEAQNDYTGVYNDLVAALDEWNTIYALCGSLELNIKGNSAKLIIGMSADEVNSAMATEETVDFVTYINNYSIQNAAVA
jgi:hypothetical protein